MNMIDRMPVKELLSFVNEQLMTGIVIYQDKVVYANHHAEDLLKYDKQTLYQKSFADFLPDNDVRSEIVSIVEMRLRGEERDHSYDCLELVDANGEVLFIKGSSCTISYDGKPAGLFSFVDVTKEIRYKQKSMEQDIIFKKLIESSPAGIYIYRDKIVYANNTFCEQSGFALDELQQRTSWDLVHESQREDVRRTAMDRLAGNIFDKVYTERYLITKDGETRCCKVATSTIMINGEEHGLVVGIDITQLKELQKNLEDKVVDEISKRERSEEALSMQSRMATMGELLRLITHQWKQPLNSIALITEYMTGCCKECNDGNQLDYIKTIADQTFFLSQTIDDFSKFMSASRNKQKFDIILAVQEVVNLFHHYFECSNIELSFTHEGLGLNDACMYGFANDFKNAILNFITNARDAIIYSKTRNKKFVRLDLTLQGDSFVLTVEDSGGGIPEGLMERIFEKNFTTKGEKGTGIGMYIIKMIIEETLKGRVSVENTTAGAKFTVKLPAVSCRS